MKKHCYLILFLFFALYACKKEDIPEARKEYPVKFIFINNGDAVISKVTLFPCVGYPQEGILHWYGTSKARPVPPYQSDKELRDYDEVIIDRFDDVYVGCVVDFDITVWTPDTMGIGRPRSYYRTNTIKGPEDCTIVFIWPDDTVHYRSYDTQYGR